MVRLEMRNLPPECCQFVTSLTLLVAAQCGAPLSPSPSSWLWAPVWTRRDCFMAPVGHFTISFSLKNFKKKPPRLHYLCIHLELLPCDSVQETWQTDPLLWRAWNMSPCCGLVPGTRVHWFQEADWFNSKNASLTPAGWEQLFQS